MADEKEEVKEKTEAEKRQEVRDAIKVTKTEAKKDDDEKEEKEDEVEEKEDDDASETKEDEAESSEDDKEDEKEDDEPTKQTKSVEKLERTIARLQKRIDKTTGSNKALAKELSDAQKKLEAKQAEGEEVLTKEDIEKRAKEIATQEITHKEFIQACNRLADNAQKALKLKNKEFDAKVAEVTEDIGPFPSQMIGILDDLDNGGAVLAHLLNEVDEMEEIYSLPLAKMTTRLVRLSDKVKPQEKKLSKVPAPNEPIGGSAGSPKFDPYNVKNPKDWIEKRNKDVAEKRAAKAAAFR